MSAISLSGCIFDDDLPIDDDPSGAYDDAAPYLGYRPPEPDAALELLEEDFLLPGDGVEIHARIVRPVGDGPFPVIVEYTPYTAPSWNPLVSAVAEPGLLDGWSVSEFVRRGYAFAFADVRGTGDSSGCLDLRGPNDIKDQIRLTEWLGTQDWSNGNVGYIGASYPGSTSHMAGIAGGEHLKAIVPVVASTSFYHYHHNDGVPYRGNHSPGGTNSGYTGFALAPTVNPQHPNYVTRYAEESRCPMYEQMFEHGGLDQSGAYYEWWMERNLRPLVDQVDVPVLMAQGLADWNVKPDHIATWFNDLAPSNASKTLIAGQWGHAYPRSSADSCNADQNWRQCDTDIPYGTWFDYVGAFFDTFLKEIDTGMFERDVAWVQDTEGEWHRSNDWPLLPEQRETRTLHLSSDGTFADMTASDEATMDWFGCAADQGVQDWLLLGKREMGINLPAAGRAEAPHRCDGLDGELVFESETFDNDTIVSGVPLLDLRLTSEADFTHIVAVLYVIDEDGDAVRQNYGYLNPTYRDGLDAPHDVVPGDAYNVTVDFYPQEDVIKKGEKVRLVIRSHDNGNTIEAFKDGTNTIQLGPENVNALTLPVRPMGMQGARLTS